MDNKSKRIIQQTLWSIVGKAPLMLIPGFIPTFNTPYFVASLVGMVLRLVHKYDMKIGKDLIRKLIVSILASIAQFYAVANTYVFVIYPTLPPLFLVGIGGWTLIDCLLVYKIGKFFDEEFSCSNFTKDTFMQLKAPLISLLNSLSPKELMNDSFDMAGLLFNIT